MGKREVESRPARKREEEPTFLMRHHRNGAIAAVAVAAVVFHLPLQQFQISVWRPARRI